MTGSDEQRDFVQWAADWQAGGDTSVTTETQIRHYVKRRSNLMWSFVVVDGVIVGVALPVLGYLAAVARNGVERFSMIALATITIATVTFSWWNWHGVLRGSASRVSEYVELSRERIARMRLAWRAAWVVLAAELIVFTIWITDMLYFGDIPHTDGQELFAWGWLILFSLAFVGGLVSFGRWLTRDAARFEALRQELERGVDERG